MLRTSTYHLSQLPLHIIVEILSLIKCYAIFTNEYFVYYFNKVFLKGLRDDFFSPIQSILQDFLMTSVIPSYCQ